jgi:hypothetical protein
MDPASGDLSQALVDELSDNTGSGASEDRLRPDALRFNREHSFAYGPKTCTLSLGGKPDVFDRALSVTVWFILVIGLVTALLLAALDPLNLESNYLDALYKYLSVLCRISRSIASRSSEYFLPLQGCSESGALFSVSAHARNNLKTVRISLRLEGDVIQRRPNAVRDSAVVEVVEPL